MSEYTATIEFEIENGVEWEKGLSIESATATAETIVEQIEDEYVDVSAAETTKMEVSNNE